jgi:DNA-binding NtrC family response regulator
VTVDVRVIATTTRDVEQGVASGMFRQDLFYSLGVVTLDVPPLRDRSEDVPMLALRVAQRAAAEAGKVVTGFSPEALRRLVAYPWPGNVQELQHAVERAVILSNEEMLQAAPFEQLPGSASHRAPGQAPAEAAGAAPTGTPAAGAAGDAHHCVVLDTLNVDHAERALIKRALEVTGGNRTRTAELLGISVRTLRNKLNGPSQKAVAVD